MPTKIKDLRTLRHFLGMEMAQSKQGIYVCWRKYVHYFLYETGLTWCKPASTHLLVQITSLKRKPRKLLLTEEKHTSEILNIRIKI